MKSKPWSHLCRTVILVAVGWMAWSCSSPTESAPAATVPVPKVTVGTQNGVIASGSVGGATFAITTANIAAGTVGTVTWFTSAAGTAAITAPSGLVTLVTPLAANTATVNIGCSTVAPAAGTYYFKVSIGSAISATATLTISAAGTSSVILGPQGHALTAGVAGTTTFGALAANIAVGTTGTITWYTTAVATTPTTAPVGISVDAFTLAATPTTPINFTASTAVAPGDYYFTVTFGATTSPVATLSVTGTGVPSVALGPQNGAICTGPVAAGNQAFATFVATTSNIAADTVGTVTWYSSLAGTTSTTAPAGVFAGTTKVAGNAATVSIFWQAGTTVPAAGAYYFKVTFGTATSATATLTVSAVGTPSILLGTQSGALTNGITGTAYFIAITSNITVGTTGTVTWYTSAEGTTVTSAPAGVSNNVPTVGTSETTAGTITGAGIGFTTGRAAVAGTYYFKVTLGSATSAVGTLTIAGGGPTAWVDLAPQTGTLTSGTSGSATFAGSTAGLADGTSGSIVWYKYQDGTTEVTAPTGLTASAAPVSANATTVTFAGTPTVGGTFYFKVAFGSVTSAVATLKIGFPGLPSVTLGAQKGTLTGGTYGSVTLPVTTANVAEGTYGKVSWYTSSAATTETGPPPGLSDIGFTTKNNVGSVTVYGTAVEGGTFYFTVTCGSAVSAVTALTVGFPGPPSAVLGTQSGTLAAGMTGSAAYSVTLANLAVGTPGAVIWYSSADGSTTAAAPPGVTTAVTPVANRASVVSLVADTTSVAGTYYFKAVFGGATSAVGTLVVSPAGTTTITLGGPSTLAFEGKGGTLTYPAVTANLANGASGTVTWYTSQAGTTSVAAPAGISATVSPVASDRTTVTVATDSSAAGGWYYFKVTVGSAVSVVNTLVVQPKIVLAPVTGGTFYAGAANMTVSSFQMGVTVVTQAQYLAVMGTNPSKSQGNLRYPVESVSWYSALVFCNTRSLQEGLTPAFSIGGSRDPSQWGAVPTVSNATWDAATMDLLANGYRLPTASEWLWAAMGGLSDSQPGDITAGINTLGYKKPFSGSNGTNAIADYAGSFGMFGYPGSFQVGTKRPNELGLYEMNGNVDQWFWDPWPVDYVSSPKTDYLGGTFGGGRYSYGDTLLATSPEMAYSSWNNPYSLNSHTGFRVVRSVR